VDAVQVACTSSYLAQTAACLVPALSLPSELADTASTTAHVAGAAASFVGTTTRADVFVGVRMNSPLSYRDLDASLQFYPPPTVYRVAGVIEVVRGQTVTLTIQVGRQLSAQLYFTRFDEPGAYANNLHLTPDQCRLYLHLGPGHPQPNGAPRL